MIALHSECLLFQLNNGESVPCSADMIAIEIVGEVNGLLEPETLRHAAASVFHYFKTELSRETVTIGEFSLALEKALHHLGYSIHAQDPGAPPPGSGDGDLIQLAQETGGSLELLFFPRLRDELPSGSATRRSWCGFTACAVVSSSSPAPGAGAAVASSCRIRSWIICAVASRRKPTRITVRWWWSEGSTR